MNYLFSFVSVNCVYNIILINLFIMMCLNFRRCILKLEISVEISSKSFFFFVAYHYEWEKDEDIIDQSS